MSVSSWRAVLLTLCFVATVINAVSLFTDSIQASSALGFQVSRTVDPAVVRVDAVDQGGAADASGLRVGDLIHVGTLAPGERYRLLTGVYPHEQLQFEVSRGNVTIPIRYAAGGAPVRRWDTWLYMFTSFWMLAFAALIGWRRADSREGRVLCVLLALYPGASGLLQGTWIGPSPLADVIAAAIAVIPYALAILCAWSALAAARGAERSRVAWIMAPLIVFYFVEGLLYGAAVALLLGFSIRFVHDRARRRQRHVLGHQRERPRDRLAAHVASQTRFARRRDRTRRIEDLAHHVGGVLDVLGHSPGNDEPILAELRAMHRAIFDGFAALQTKLDPGSYGAKRSSS